MTREQLDALYSEAGRRYNVDPRLLRAIAVVESGERADALGPPVLVNGQTVRAVGLMQIIPSTARALGIDPQDPRQSVFGAARLMSMNLDQAQGDVEEALRLYYAGPSMRNRGPRTAAYPGQVARVYVSLPPYSPQQAAAPATGDEDIFDALAGRSDAAARSNVVTPSEDILREMAQESDDEELFNELVRPNANVIPENRVETMPRTRVGAGSRFARGLERGIRDLVDKPAEILAGALSPYMGGPSRSEVAAGNRQAREAFDNEMRGSGFATAGRITGNVASVLGPMGVAAGVGRAASSLVPGSAGRFLQGSSGAGPLVGGLASRTAQRATGGAASGAVGGALLADPTKDIRDEVGLGAAIGAGVSTTLGPLAASAYRGIRNTFGGFPSRNTADVAAQAMRMGIPVYGPQITTSPPIRYLDSHLRDVMFSGHQARTAGGREAFTRAVARLIGEPMAMRLDADVRRAANQRISNVFQNVARGRSINFDAQAQARLAQIENDILSTPMDSGVQRAMARLIENIRNAGASGTMSGEAYLGLTRYGTPLGRSIRSNDVNISFYARQLREMLDDMLERSAPDAAAELRQARQQFRYMVNLVSPSTKGTREGTIEGIVDPLIFARNAYRMDPRLANMPVGQNPVADLARAGLMFAQPPNSGTAARIAATTGGFLGLPGLGTAAAGLAFGSPQAVELGVAGAVGGGLAANLMSRILASDAYRNYMLAGARRNSPYANTPSPPNLNNLATAAGISSTGQDFSIPNPLSGAAVAASPVQLDALPEASSTSPGAVQVGDTFYILNRDDNGVYFWQPTLRPPGFGTPGPGGELPPHYVAPNVIEITRARPR
jgi:hypothetical protein